MKKIVIIHTTPATIQSLAQLSKKIIPNVEVINILDDSILKDMINERHVDLVEKRWLNYVEIGQSMGADAVLSACSTVGGFVKKAATLFKIPVYRIDEAMAKEAVAKGKSICVVATLSSTLNPTVSLIRDQMHNEKKECLIHTILVEGAYEQLMSGHLEEHNQMIKEQVEKIICTMDIVVLAQASMASALNGIADELLAKVLTSPESGIIMLKEKLNL